MNITAKDEKGSLHKQLLKKIEKEKKLCDSAFELFSNKGVNETSIEDIVKGAGVAKGTFYLYFKDKYDIIDRIVLKKTSAIMQEAVLKTIEKGFSSFEDDVIFFIDYLIEYLRENKRLLKIIHKNLSWGLFRKAIANKEQIADMMGIREYFRDRIKKEMKERDFEKNLFMIMELVGATCYSSIILEEPDNIDNMKPALFLMIRKMIK